MTYTIKILRSVQKQLTKIEHKEQLRIIEAIQKLAEKPRTVGCKKLSGRPAWRIRVGSYRVYMKYRMIFSWFWWLISVTEVTYTENKVKFITM